MSKTRDTGYLANVIQVHDTGVRIMSGSTMLMAVSSSGAVTITGEISGSDAANSLLLSGTGSVGFTTTSSFLAVSSSQQEVSASYIALSGSYNTFSGSASTRITENSSSIQQVSSSQQQISSSLLQVSASYISLSGSYTTFSGSASTRITVDSASLLQVSASQQQISSSLLNVISIFATTGSNSFRATQSITGSLTVTGQIIAQTLNVQQVTSSIIYSSGSNNFGCDLNSRQTFTGSVLITGSLTIAGGSSANSYSGTTIYGSTAVCSAVGKFTSCIDAGAATFSSDVAISGSSGALYSLGQLGFTNTGAGGQYGIYTLGTATPTMYFDHRATGNTGQWVWRSGTGGATTALTLSNAGAATFSSTITGTTIYGSTAVCSPVGKFTSCIDAGTGTFSGQLSGPSAIFLTSDNGVGTKTIVSTFERYGASPSATSREVGFVFKDASNPTLVGGITGIRNNSSGNYYGGLKFYVMSASGTPATSFSDLYTALSLDNGGTATFSSTITGTTIYGSTAVCSAVGKFTSCIDAGTGYFSSNVTAVRGFFNSGGNATDPIISVTGDTNTGFFFPSADTIATTVAGTERMRITSGGNVSVKSDVASNTVFEAWNTNTTNGYGGYIRGGQTSGDYALSVAGSGGTEYLKVRGDGWIISPTTYNNTSGVAANLGIDSSGNIFRSTSSSKYKKDIKSYDKGLDTVLLMNPIYYKSKSEFDGGKQFAGFIAEEIDTLGLNEFVQYNDETNEPEGLNYGNITAILTKAIQELKAQNDTLKEILQRNNIQ